MANSLENEKGFAVLLVAALNRGDAKWAMNYADAILSSLRRTQPIEIELKLPAKEKATCIALTN